MLRGERCPGAPAGQGVQTLGGGRGVIPQSVIEIVESLDRAEPTCSTGAAGRAALEMVMSFHESHHSGNGRVDLPLTNRDRRILVRDAAFISSAKPNA